MNQTQEMNNPEVMEIDLTEATATKSETQSGHQLVGDFKITVKKLEMPVRPRGVLAE